MRTTFFWNFFLAGALAAPQAATSTSSAAASVCTGNTASDRSVWCDYSVQTDWYTEVPDTGETVEVRQSLRLEHSESSLNTFSLKHTVLKC